MYSGGLSQIMFHLFILSLLTREMLGVTNCMHDGRTLSNIVGQQCCDQPIGNTTPHQEYLSTLTPTFQFSCRFAFLSTFRLPNWTPKITQILMLHQANVPNLATFSK